MYCTHIYFFFAGLTVISTYEDISYKKVATQSPTSTALNSEARNAVDGNIATCVRTGDIGSTAQHKTVWWIVDLGRDYNIYSINIQFKNYDGYGMRQKGRFAGFSLYVSDTDVSSISEIKSTTLCYKDGPQLPPLNFTTKCTEKGRYVIYYNERLDGVIYPGGYETQSVYTELCEVIVHGCKNVRVYGSSCDTPCPTNCYDNTCHIQNGTCFTCKPGWTGTYCNTKCGQGWYGVNCSQHCVGHCKNSMSCNHATGLCDEGCAAGWTGTMCDKECKDGTFGQNCVNNCSVHCLNNTTCNKQTGNCDRGCNPGYTNGDCSKECPAGQFGLRCINRCSEHCLIKDLCDPVSGECSGGCLDGFVGTHCNKSCNKGYFGTNCSRECSPNCQSDTCRHTDGSCSCVPGWTGDNCTTICNNAYFGTYCLRQCSSYCKLGTCRHTDGGCSCDAGRMGYNCTKACFQSYGENCQYPCSLQCHNTICDKFNRQYLLGCKDGSYGELWARDNLPKNKNMSSSSILVIGLSISLLINLIFVVCGSLLCRGIATNQVTFNGSILSCWKKSVYQNTVVKSDETSTYQELYMSENAYQNTTIR